MNRIILSALIAIGFHIGLMALMPLLFNKDNHICRLKIRQMTVCLSYRQAAIKKTSLRPDKLSHKKQITRRNKTKRPEPEISKSEVPEPKIHVLKKKDHLLIKKKTLPPEKKIQPARSKYYTPQKTITREKQNIKKNNPGIVNTESVKNQGPSKQPAARIKFARPLYRKNTLPVYPAMARRRGYHGIVELLVLVSEKGVVSGIKIFKSSGHRLLDHQALLTVKAWLFEPGRKNGMPEKMWIKIPVKFELK